MKNYFPIGFYTTAINNSKNQYSIKITDLQPSTKLETKKVYEYSLSTSGAGFVGYFIIIDILNPDAQLSFEFDEVPDDMKVFNFVHPDYLGL